MKNEMAFSINRVIFFGIFLMCSVGSGSALRVVANPQPYTSLTEKLHISCVADEPAYSVKSILTIQIMRHIQDKPIASVNMKQELKMASWINDTVKAKGHIDTATNTSYLTLIIEKPDQQNGGTYRCQMFFIDENFQMVEKNAIGNVTYEEPGTAGDVIGLARKVSGLFTAVLKQNKTMQRQTDEHIAFKNIHFKQNQDIDILSDRIDTENKTNTEQNEELIKQKDHQSRQKQDIDNLKDKIDTENETIVEQNKELDSLKSHQSRQNQDIENLNDKIDTENTTIIEQNKELDQLKDHQSRQKQDIDTLTHELDMQNKTDMKLTKQIDTQNTLIDKLAKQMNKQYTLIDKQSKEITKLNQDNTHKQQQLDLLMDYIQKQNETIEKHENKQMCPHGWTLYRQDKICLKVFDKHDDSKYLAWSGAREECQALGGDLVQIHDEDKNTFVYNLFDGSQFGFPWIGIQNKARFGFNFKFVDGSDLGDYHPWFSGYPTGAGDDDDKCVRMFTSTSHVGKWIDISCSSKSTYVCSTSSLSVL